MGREQRHTEDKTTWEIRIPRETEKALHEIHGTFGWGEKSELIAGLLAQYVADIKENECKLVKQVISDNPL